MGKCVAIHSVRLGWYSTAVGQLFCALLSHQHKRMEGLIKERPGVEGGTEGIWEAQTTGNWGQRRGYRATGALRQVM